MKRKLFIARGQASIYIICIGKCPGAPERLVVRFPGGREGKAGVARSCEHRKKPEQDGNSRKALTATPDSPGQRICPVLSPDSWYICTSQAPGQR